MVCCYKRIIVVYLIVERNDVSQIRDCGREYEILLAVQCRRKADYRAFKTPLYIYESVAQFLARVNDLIEHGLAMQTIVICWG